MNVVWEEHPLPATTIIDRVTAFRAWTPRTIRTLVDRLVKKDILRIEKDGKRFLYWPVVSRDACRTYESSTFIKRVFAGQPVSMLLHLVKETELTDADIKELRKILTQKSK